MSFHARPDETAEWLNYLQPEGLVVGANVLREKELPPLRQTPADTAEAADALGLDPEAEREDDRHFVLGDPWRFLSAVLGWPASRVAGAPGGPLVPETLARTVPEHETVLVPDMAVLWHDAPEADLPAQLLVALDPARDPDARNAHGGGWEASPHQRLERLLRETGIGVGVLIARNTLRLVYAPRGETAGWLSWPLVALGRVEGRPMLAGLKLCLNRTRLFTGAPDKRLRALLKASREAQNAVSEKLSGQVLGALHELKRGLHRADRDAVETLAETRSHHLYEGLLTCLMRLVFLLYAEDRDLLPSSPDPQLRALWKSGYSIKTLYARLLVDEALNPDTMDQRRGAWGQLLAVFRLIYEGHGNWVARRGGKLLDPDAFPFLEGREAGSDRAAARVLPVSDGTVLRILHGLMTIEGRGLANEKVRERLSYRALDVESIGSVYETVMGFTMLDLPDHAVVISGLQGWRYAGGWTPVEEDRLVPLLKQQLGGKLSPNFAGLRQPPVHDDERRGLNLPGIDVMVFPTWFTVDNEQGAIEISGPDASTPAEKRRRMVTFGELSATRAGKLSYSGEGKQRGVNPIRFVAACPHGHLQDIDWRYMAHRSGGDLTCRKPMFWAERGVSSDPSDIFVRCTCGASVSLSDLYRPKFLGTCSCQSPWLQPRRTAEETCSEDLRLLPRSATNTYFAQTVTVISLASGSSRLRQAIQDHRSFIDSLKTLPNVAAILRSAVNTKDVFAPFSEQEIGAALDDASASGAASVANPRVAEFDLLASGTPIIGNPDPNSYLFAETLQPDASDNNARAHYLLKGLVRVHRLREVTCLYGFTRLEPPPSAAESELDEIQLAVDGADLVRQAEWLPALAQFGEGIFLHVNPECLKQWLDRPTTIDKAQVLKQGEIRDSARFHRPPMHLGIAYWTLHSLSHALLAELALDCGYPLSSLKERIYASGPAQPERFGILIYTSTPGGQGTLGGLSSMAEKVPMLLARALKRLTLCSNDPICAEHTPESDHDDRPLQGAACHACLLIPETSCEARNTRLDRSLLVDTVVDHHSGLFAAQEIPL